MQNMVWSYCKRISPEWKVQVRGHKAFPQDQAGRRMVHHSDWQFCG